MPVPAIPSRAGHPSTDGASATHLGDPQHPGNPAAKSQMFEMMHNRTRTGLDPAA